MNKIVQTWGRKEKGNHYVIHLIYKIGKIHI